MIKIKKVAVHHIWEAEKKCLTKSINRYYFHEVTNVQRAQQKDSASKRSDIERQNLSS